MNTSSLARVAALFSIAAALGACGGGSDAAAPAENAPPPSENPGQNPPPSTSAFTLSLSTDKALVIQGATATVTATVARSTGFAGAVQVTLANLPAGVSAPTVLIAEGATSATITLTAAASAAHTLPTAARADGASGNQSASKPLTVTVGGAPGVQDTSFNGGTQFTSVAEGEDYATALAVQADGKVISAGRTSTAAGGHDIAVVRFQRDGTLDTSFGNGGKVTTSVAAGTDADEASAIAVQADGKVVVAGSTDNGANGLDFALVRYNADGSLDTTFGTGGKVVTTMGASTDRIYAIAIQTDGKIVVGGDTYAGTATGVDFALARYNTNGTLDTNFGTGGKVVTPVHALSSRDSVYALRLQTIQGEQRIVAVGGEGDFIAARYSANGQLDASFGSGGKVSALFGSTIGGAYAVVEADGGKLVLAGGIQNNVALARLNADGTLDAGFGTGGTLTTALSATNWSGATALVRQADGKLIAGGWVYEVGSSANFAAVRYTADGTLDAGFGNAGKVITPVASSSRSDSGRALVLQADERVPTVRALQAGEANEGGGNQFALLRYWL